MPGRVVQEYRDAWGASAVAIAQDDGIRPEQAGQLRPKTLGRVAGGREGRGIENDGDCLPDGNLARAALHVGHLRD